MIWTRDRYISHCQHQFTGREMFCELFGPMHILENEWRCQGATKRKWNDCFRLGLCVTYNFSRNHRSDL